MNWLIATLALVGAAWLFWRAMWVIATVLSGRTAVALRWLAAHLLVVAELIEYCSAQYRPARTRWTSALGNGPSMPAAAGAEVSNVA